MTDEELQSNVSIQVETQVINQVYIQVRDQLKNILIIKTT